MSKPLFALVAALALCGLSSTPSFAANSQQDKMKSCNAQASGKKGDDRKAFMKSCLSASPSAQATTPQERMKSCNTQASGKKGDDRKAFMKSCLSNKG